MVPSHVRFHLLHLRKDVVELGKVQERTAELTWGWSTFLRGETAAFGTL